MGKEVKKTRGGLANRGSPFIEVENVKKEGIYGSLGCYLDESIFALISSLYSYSSINQFTSI